MSAAPGLPPPGASLALRVSFVDVRPEAIPVQLWGQAGGRRAGAGEGAEGEQGQPGQQGQQDQQGQPGPPAPAALGCVLAGLAPAGGGAGAGEPQLWPAGALDFLRRLQGREVRGRVLDVLSRPRLLLLEAPGVLRRMQELGLARRLPDRLFRPLLERHLAAPAPAPLAAPGPPACGLDFFYPRLQLGVTEPVLVTQVSHPQRVHCRLRGLSQEVLRLSESLARAYRGAPAGAGPGAGEPEEGPDKPGSPCAACGLDGRWYRALLLETFRPRRCAQVLHVDLGRKELVSCSSLRYLLPEFFRMPVVTFPCALYGLWDGGRGWSRSQVGRLKALILGQALSAKIEFYCAFEHVYYVTLYGEDGLDLNSAFGAQAGCLADRVLQGRGAEEDEDGEEDPGPAPPRPPAPAPSPAGDRDGDGDGAGAGAGDAAERPPAALRAVRLRTHAFYDAQVEFVRSPSEFWIRLRRHGGPFGRLLRRMRSFYSSASKLDGVVLRPEPSDLCCVRWKENGYFRATVTRLDDQSVDVFLVDRGNSESVGWLDLRMLLPQFRRLPALAQRCALADIWPLGKAWSPEAISFFKKTVLHKELVIHVLDKQDGQYVIEILDESRTGEENISKVIAQAGYAKYQEFETKEDVGPSAQAPGQAWGQFVGESNGPAPAGEAGEQAAGREPELVALAEASSDTRTARKASARQAAPGQGNVASVYAPLTASFSTSKPGAACREELDVGSTVEVQVSHVETPGYFWCQLTRNAQAFKTLMCDVEDHCKNSAASCAPRTAPACLAKRTATGKWSRALISGTQSPEQVKVVFVDYGDGETVSAEDTYSISEELLQVRAQAFRCSLYNLIQPTGENPLVWDDKAVQAFSEFVDSARQNNLELKCTIFALASIRHEEPFNVVDLLTPFQSACRFLVEKGLARPVKLQKPLEPSVQLHSYYYSTHDMKIGSEEPVFVTHVEDAWTFYCQLARNTNVLEQLSCSITQLSKVLLSLKTSSPLTPGTLCLAKYTDGNWYRGIVIEEEPTKVFFVDFGNIYVTSDNLLPIPCDTYDVLLLPMQAVKCSLSDIPKDIPEEVTRWFQETVLDKSLKALVVAKDPDGRLIIELYNDSIQINANINEKLGLRGYKNQTRKNKEESEDSPSATETLGGKGENVALSPTQSLSKSGENKLYSAEVTLGESCKPKIISTSKELKRFQSPTKENPATQCQDSMGSRNNQVLSLTREKKEEIFAEPPLKATKLEAARPERITGDLPRAKDLPRKFRELPWKTIRPGFKTTVYISHVNDLSDFYVQLIEDEADINRLSERLNSVKTRPQYHAGPPWQSGDAICAVFPEDDLWYRAVVKEQQPNGFLSVQFIDYGNVSVVHTSKTGRLDLVNALLPGLGIHCSLMGLWVPDIVNCKEMTRYFSQRTEEAQVRCEFVRFQDRWEVILADKHGMIAEDLMSRFGPGEKPLVGLSTQRAKGNCVKSANRSEIDTSVFLNWYNPQMRMVRAYATVVDGPEYFWCQLADTEKLQHLEVEVEAAGKQLLDWRNCIRGPHIGDPCIVRYREDGHYYRALITNICEDSLVSVRLVDFGNSEECVDPKTLWSLPPDLLSVPMQAFPCCLSGFIVSGGVCPQEGNDYFYDIVTEHVLDITILEIRRDVCDIPLAIVDLQSKGESITEKMKKYSKMNMVERDLPYERSGPEIKGPLGTPSPSVGGKKPSKIIVQDKTLFPDLQADELSERMQKDLNITETKPSKFCDLRADNIFEALENVCKDKIGSEVLEGEARCHFADQADFKDKYLVTGFNTLLPQARAAKEILELNSLEVPLSPDDESKDSLELESMELQQSLVGDEDKEESGLGARGCDTEATLKPFTVPLPLDPDTETPADIELPTVQLSLDDSVSPVSLEVSSKVQESGVPEDVRKASSGAEALNDLHLPPSHLPGNSCDPQTHAETSLFEKEFPECKHKGRAADSSFISLFSEEEPGDRRKPSTAPSEHAAAQLQDTCTLKGFAVGSKCVVWSSLRNTWSKCEILEIAEEGTRVLDLSNGVEEIVNPENVWNGIPKLDKSPPVLGRVLIQPTLRSKPSDNEVKEERGGEEEEPVKPTSTVAFQELGKDLCFVSSDDTSFKEKESGGDVDLSVDP